MSRLDIILKLSHHQLEALAELEIDRITILFSGEAASRHTYNSKTSFKAFLPIMVSEEEQEPTLSHDHHSATQALTSCRCSSHKCNLRKCRSRSNTIQLWTRCNTDLLCHQHHPSNIKWLLILSRNIQVSKVSITNSLQWTSRDNHHIRIKLRYSSVMDRCTIRIRARINGLITITVMELRCTLRKIELPLHHWTSLVNKDIRIVSTERWTTEEWHEIHNSWGGQDSLLSSRMKYDICVILVNLIFSQHLTVHYLSLIQSWPACM